MKNIINTDYMTLDEFMSTIELDFKKYANSGLIDKDSLYSTIAYCNSIAGVVIAPLKHIVQEIKSCKTDLPENFYKIKSIDIISNFLVPSSLSFFQVNSKETGEKQKKETPLYTPIGCINDCGKCYWHIPPQEKVSEMLVFTNRTRLNCSDNCSYLKSNEYAIDKEEEIIEFKVSTGKVVICYYEDVTKLGLIPKDPILFPWWSWSIKHKILQDLLMNSEDDVSQKLIYAERQMTLAYADMDSYTKSRSFKRMMKEKIEREQNFYHKWVEDVR